MHQGFDFFSDRLMAAVQMSFWTLKVRYMSGLLHMPSFGVFRNSLCPYFRRLKCFAGGNVSSVEIFRRWKFRHFAKFSSLSTDVNV